MGTKIYNGYMARMGLVDLLNEFKKMVEPFDILKKTEYTRELVRSSVFEIDKRVANGEDADQEKILDEKHEKFEKEIENTILLRKRSPSIDFSVRCSVFPLKKNKTLILLFEDNDKALELWNSYAFIEDYHYQNQCDPPTNISKHLWDKRRTDWDLVLGGNGCGTPRDNGYLFEFSDERLPWRVQKGSLMDFVPSDDERATHLFKNMFIDKTVEENSLGLPEDNRVSCITGIWLRAHDEWKEFKETSDYAVQIEELKNKLTKITF